MQDVPETRVFQVRFNEKVCTAPSRSRAGKPQPCCAPTRRRAPTADSLCTTSSEAWAVERHAVSGLLAPPAASAGCAPTGARTGRRWARAFSCEAGNVGEPVRPCARLRHRQSSGSPLLDALGPPGPRWGTPPEGVGQWPRVRRKAADLWSAHHIRAVFQELLVPPGRLPTRLRGQWTPEPPGDGGSALALGAQQCHRRGPTCLCCQRAPQGILGT